MTNRTLTTSLAGLAFVGLLGACGSDDDSEADPGESAGSQGSQEVYDWVDCMAGEGIELPEPSKNADGDLVIVGDGVNLSPEPGEDSSFGEYSDEEFQVGADVCGPPPILSGMSDETRQEEADKTLAYSECMRENGVESFPDPETSPVEDEAEGGGQIVTPFDPDKTREAQSDPDFEAADEACRDIMIPGGAASQAGEDSDE